MFSKLSGRIRLAGALAVVTLALVTQAFGATAAAEPCYDAYYDGLWACSQEAHDPRQAPTAGGGGIAVFRAM